MNEWKDKTAQNQCKQLEDIKCEILEWKGRKPNSNIQAIARQSRYDLIKKACNKNNIIKYRLAGPITKETYNDFYKLVKESHKWY